MTSRRESESMQKSQKLITPEFVALNAVMFLTFCNLAVFFQFHSYLGTLPIDPDLSGLLIGMFSVTVLIMRPIISPLLRPDNARRWMGISCFFVVVSLLLYHVALGFWSMALVRLFHGAAYVVMATAVTARLVGCIPKDRSGQAFGLISVITLLPYAVMPPLLEPLTRWVGNFRVVLDLSAVVMLLSFPVLAFVGGASDGPDRSSVVLRWQDVKENLKDSRILLLLFLSLVVWTAFTPIFFFLKDYGTKIGVPNPGWFFTLSTFTEIAVRLVAGSLFDKVGKAWALAGSLAWLAAGYIAMAHLSEPTTFYAMGLLLGLGWGVAMPVLSGLVFDVSEPRFRALNTNLSFEMFQAGFFVGPLAGGAILVHSGYLALYYACGGITILGLIAALALGMKRHEAP
jgi:predicted MFS family arabinose efflux permease